MLENIKGLKIQGRCFSEETDLILFPNPNDRISIAVSYTHLTLPTIA